MLEPLRAQLRLLMRGGYGRLATVVASALVVFSLLAGPATAAPNASIVVDHKTGKVLYSSNADAQRYPASLTKMMTLYLLFEAIESGRTSLDSKIKMSAFAASQPPSKLGVKAGRTIVVRDAILALVTRSANDVATAIAEHISGSEKAFAQAMTSRARELGMSKTTFRNAHGLPNSAQVTTARDMATLGRALQDHFPQYFSYFATKSFAWAGSRIGNHNRLLGRVEGVNGIKTGYTRASGYNLVTSVDRDGRQIVAVVLGGDTGKARDARMAELIKKYLPKASRGSRTAPLVARGPGAPAVAARAVLVQFPMPRLRPTTTVLANAEAPVAAPAPAAEREPVLVAAEAAREPVLVAAKPAPAPIPVTPAAELTAPTPDMATAFAPTSIANVIGANSIFALEALEFVEQEGDAAIVEDEVVSAVTPPPTPAVEITVSGWKIQLAATPTQESAEALLDRARAKAPTLLAGVSPYTEPVEAGSAILYRARFGGFDSKESARAACAQLSKQNFNCLAISN
jgi:D-alanyl-D-alanine carboxypeptidase